VKKGVPYRTMTMEELNAMIDKKNSTLDDYEQGIEDIIETFVPVSAKTKARIDAAIDKTYSPPFQVNPDRLARCATPPAG
jgi:hypothetical protein